MSYPYPTNITKSSDIFTELMQWTNDVSGGIFGIGLLLAIMTVIFMSVYFSSGNAANAFRTSLFIGLILSIFMVILGILQFYYVIVLVVVLFFSIVFIKGD